MIFEKTVKRFREFPRDIRLLVVNFWIWGFAQLLVGSFLNIFLYLETKSLAALALYNTAVFTGIFFGFVVWGRVLPRFQIEIKKNFQIAAIVGIVSFLLLSFGSHTLRWLLVFALANGIATGMFWVGHHAFEVLHTTDRFRDFYSSMLSAGSQILGVAAPALATVLFLLSERWLHQETFFLFFWVVPVVYLFSLPIASCLSRVVPPRVSITAIQQLAFSRGMGSINAYYVLCGFQRAIPAILVPLIALSALERVVNIGIFETTIRLLAIGLTLYLAHRRQVRNRVSLMRRAVIGQVIGFALLFFWQSSPIFFVIYSLINLIVSPVLSISAHLIHLHTIDTIKQNGVNFYAGLLYRDSVLWLGGLVSAAILWVYAEVVHNPVTTIWLGLILSATSLVAVWMTARKFVDEHTDSE